MTSFMLMTVPVHAAPPVDEIYAIMSAKALRMPSRDPVNELDNKHLEKRLLVMDPYARYIPPKSSSKDSHMHVKLGIDVFVHKSQLWIQPVSRGAADRTGLPEIGVLWAINGVKVQGYNLERISVMLDKAVRKDHVVLTVSDGPRNKWKDYRVETATDELPSITWRRIDNDIFISINEFIAHYTATGLSVRFDTLVGPTTRVILDLRGCSGGDLYEVLEIAGMFVPTGLPLVNIYDRKGVVKKYLSPSGQKLKSPIWVLIDGRTASAAEILAGILQYHNLTRVVGERSYGKCLSQKLFPLSDGGGLWLTTLDVRFPDNKSCTGIGIKPNVSYPDISVAKLATIIGKIKF